MLILIHTETCPFCQKVESFFKENNVEYTSVISRRGEKSRQILQDLGGKQQIPFLIDFEEGVYMYESGDIIDYVQKKYL